MKRRDGKMGVRSRSLLLQGDLSRRWQSKKEKKDRLRGGKGSSKERGGGVLLVMDLSGSQCGRGEIV